MIDIEELFNLYLNGDIYLSEDKQYIYQNILNIDYLSTEEKIELHETLKNYNMIEMFYDDMSEARNIVRQALKDSAITKDELSKFRNKQLSEQYGVDVYSIEDEPFFAIVKSHIPHIPDELPTGHSYSLVGNGGIITFKDEKTYVYDSDELNPEQIVHIFPFDSYTLYRPNSSNEEPTPRINTLMMPDELVEYAPHSYTEVLIYEQGSKPTDIDKRIPKLKMIAKYCIDKITEEDVKEAQINGVGIMLINSSKCKKTDNKERGLYRHHLESIKHNLDYFNGTYHVEEFESRRKA